jgi:hypothetical protein
VKKPPKTAPSAAEPFVARVVPVGDLRANVWNPNAMTPFMAAKARTSIQQFGFVDPILVRTVPGADGFEIVDGEQRWHAAKAQGLAEVSVLDMGNISDHAAGRLTIVLNETRGQFDRVGLSALVADLLADPDAADLARDVLPYDERELGLLAAISSFDWGADPTASPDTPDEHVSFEKGTLLKVHATEDQILNAKAAIASVKASAPTLTDGAALERLAAAYLTSVGC